MRLEDYEVKTIEEFYGLYSNGTIDQVPENYWSACKNMDFNKKLWKSRSGTSTFITLGYGAGNGKVRRFAGFADAVFGSMILILDDAGNLYTYSSRAGDTATAVRLAMGASATDFSAIRIFNKIYLAFHDGQYGLSGVNLKVFIPHPTTVASDVFRDAAGLAPTAGGAMGAANGAAGEVNAGVYLIAVAYITTSGFITQPGPKVAAVFTPTSYTAPGAVKISVTSIPTGPAGTAQRQLLITKANEEEYFFLSSSFGGLINDNTTTTATLNFDDTTDLVDSADYLFDMLETIPAPLILENYNGKLVTGGENANNSILRVSRNGEPESFDSVDGIVFVNKDDGFSIRNSIVVRDILYAWKNLGVFSIRDNDDFPSTWPVNPIDMSVNTCVHGIAEFFDLSGVRMARDWSLIVDRSGILLFDGIIRKPPITDNINDLWQTINFTYFHKIVLCVDEQNHKIYCAFPSGAATENNNLIMGDYNNCEGNIPSVNGIKWSPWEFTTSGAAVLSPTEIGLIGGSTVPLFNFGSITGGGKIFKLDPTVIADNTFPIEHYWQTGLYTFAPGHVNLFAAFRLRIIGVGAMDIALLGEDSIANSALSALTLVATPGFEYLRRFNFQNEKCRLRFTGQNSSVAYMTVSKLELFGKSIYQMRPA